jgi:hypothetical protein
MTERVDLDAVKARLVGLGRFSTESVQTRRFRLAEDVPALVAEVERLRDRCAVLEEAALRDGVPPARPVVVDETAPFVAPDLSLGEG